MALTFAISLAAMSAAFFAASYLGQHRAVAPLAPLQIVHPARSLRRLLINRAWLLASASSWVGWALYVAALALAPLAMVQAVAASTLGMLMLVAGREDRTSRARERRGALLGMAGLAVVLASARTTSPPEHPSIALILVLIAVAIALAGVVLVAAPARGRGAALGAASGLSYGAGDVATKAAVLGEPKLVPVILACAALGFVFLQLSYQRASVLVSAGLSVLLTNAIPIAAGLVLFGESPLRAPARYLQLAGFTAVIIGAVATSRTDRRAVLPTDRSAETQLAGGRSGER